jgi:hypothetical protein
VDIAQARLSPTVAATRMDGMVDDGWRIFPPRNLLTRRHPNDQSPCSDTSRGRTSRGAQSAGIARSCAHRRARTPQSAHDRRVSPLRPWRGRTGRRCVRRPR